MVVKKTIIYWRDIPSQVVVQKGRKRVKALLSQRFQDAIDRAAMRAGKGSSTAYLEEWRRDAEKFQSSDAMQDIADRAASEFEAEYTDDYLLQLIRNHGSASD